MRDLPPGLLPTLRKEHKNGVFNMRATDAIESVMESIGLNIVEERCRNWPHFAEHIADRAREATEPDYMGDSDD